LILTPPLSHRGKELGNKSASITRPMKTDTNNTARFTRIELHGTPPTFDVIIKSSGRRFGLVLDPHALMCDGKRVCAETLLYPLDDAGCAREAGIAIQHDGETGSFPVPDAELQEICEMAAVVFGEKRQRLMSIVLKRSV